jgi:hypothetical protein
MIKNILVFAWLGVLLAVVGGLFWYNDWVYRIPTPVPIGYHAVPTGTRLTLASEVGAPDGKPVFLHFYNPDCPCSRFNKSHFQSLVRSYGDDVHFAVVVLSDKSFNVKDIQEKIGLDIPVFFDRSLAERCGVYSTPQAALIGTDQKLYYRGNYNSSRYCTEEKTAYAKIALTNLITSKASEEFDELALKSYGCTLPICKN